jgi:hypothetical protein
MPVIPIAMFIISLCLSFVFSAPRTAHFVSIAAQKVYICPLKDSSMLSSFEGWPKEESSQKLLTSHFDNVYKNLFAEFKRCEKYGFYEMVEDSIKATVNLIFTIKQYNYQKDSLFLPVRIELKHKSGIDTYTNTIIAYGIYKPKSKPKSQFHYLNHLLADYRRNFPYKKIASLFYPPQQ